MWSGSPCSSGTSAAWPGMRACLRRSRDAVARWMTSMTPGGCGDDRNSLLRRQSRGAFRARGSAPVCADYLSGRTPIPCSLCNNHLKFDQLLVVARQIGADTLATGHYARVEFDERSGRWLLKRPADVAKDQTYFLFGLTQEQLSRTIFPLGGMTKPEVRELARRTAWRSPKSPTRRRFALCRAETTSAFWTPTWKSRARPSPILLVSS